MVISASVVPAKCNNPESIVTKHMDLFIKCQACDSDVLLIKLRPFLISKLNVGLLILKNPVSELSLPIETTEIPLSFNCLVSFIQLLADQVLFGHV